MHDIDLWHGCPSCGSCLESTNFISKNSPYRSKVCPPYTWHDRKPYMLFIYNYRKCLGTWLCTRKGYNQVTLSLCTSITTLRTIKPTQKSSGDCLAQGHCERLHFFLISFNCLSIASRLISLLTVCYDKHRWCIFSLNVVVRCCVNTVIIQLDNMDIYSRVHRHTYIYRNDTSIKIQYEWKYKVYIYCSTCFLHVCTINCR